MPDDQERKYTLALSKYIHGQFSPLAHLIILTGPLNVNCSCMLLLAVGMVSSQPLTTLADVTIVEGERAGVEIITIQYIMVSASDITLAEIMGNQHPRVFEMYFTYREEIQTIYTRCNISRDDMAVSFTIIFYAIEGILTVHRIQVTIHIQDTDNNRPIFLSYQNRPFLLHISNKSCVGCSKIITSMLQTMTMMKEMTMWGGALQSGGPERWEWFHQ